MAKPARKQQLTILQSAPLHWSDTDEGLELRGTTNGVEFSLDTGDEKRKELLELARAGKVVELAIGFVAFRQLKGKPNAKHVRFTDKALAELEESFPGQVLLRDHNTYEQDARAGTVTSAKLKRVKGGHELRLTAHVGALWAVKAVLELTFDRFSISWKRPRRDQISCSVCECEIRTNDCYHYPGQEILVAGKKRVVEWIFDSARSRECSGVNTPAVDDTYVDGVRQECALFDDEVSATPPTEDKRMNELAQIAKTLGLPEDSTLEAVLGALSAKLSEGSTNSTEVTRLTTLLGQATEAKQGAEIDQLFAAHQDRFEIECDAEGKKVQSGEEKRLRALAATNTECLKWVKTHVAALPVRTHAGKPPVHTPTPTPAPGPATALDDNPTLKSQLRQLDCNAEDHAKYNRVNGTAYAEAD